MWIWECRPQRLRTVAGRVLADRLVTVGEPPHRSGCIGTPRPG